MSWILCCGAVLVYYQTAKEVPLLTPLEKALQWAEKGEPDSIVESFVPSREERLSFAALQPIAGYPPCYSTNVLILSQIQYTWIFVWSGCWRHW